MQNIIPFGKEGQKEYRESGVGLGMLGVGGKLKVGIEKDQKILRKRQFNQSDKNGMASSVAMTPLQGMALLNPDALER